MNLEEKILDQYARLGSGFGLLPYNAFVHYSVSEREGQIMQLLTSRFKTLNDCEVLEVGAGVGGNLLFLNRTGVLRRNLYANEMDKDRLNWLKENFLQENIFPGNIIHADIQKKFDIVMQLTVFSSIPRDEDRRSVAERMRSLLKPNGVIVWYDFMFDSPNNSEVKKVTKAQIQSYFPGASIAFRRVTLAPPIARKVGRAYNLFNMLFPFLRTHLVAVIHYPEKTM